MKKVLILIGFILSISSAFGQYPIQQGIGSGSTKVTTPNYGAFSGGLIPYTFLDTTAANTALTFMKTYNGALIYSSSDSALYFRSSGATRWTQLLPSGGINGAKSWLLNGNTIGGRSAQPVLGTIDGYALPFITNNIQRATIPQDGIKRTALSSYKFVMIDTINGGSHYLAYGDAGGGAALTTNSVGYGVAGVLSGGNKLTFNGTKFNVNDGASNTMFEVDNVARTWGAGDLGGGYNTTYVTGDDVTQTVIVAAKNININPKTGGRLQVSGKLLVTDSIVATGIAYTALDTTTNKILVINSSTGNVKKSYWPTTAGSTPAGNYGNVQVNRNSLFATPAFDSLNFSSGVFITKGNAQINTLTIGLGGGNQSTNTALGYQNLSANTTGVNNTSAGYQALVANKTGNQNTAYGQGSLFTDTTGFNNTSIGAMAMYSNGTGAANNAVGVQSLYFNTTGNYNVGEGASSLYKNTSGVSNTGIGFSSIYNNTTGYNNVGVGSGTLYNEKVGHNNTALGTNALFNDTSGVNNIALGSEAGYYNTAGTGQLFINSLNRTDYTGDTTNSIIYGLQNNTMTSQRLKLNSQVFIPKDAIPITTGKKWKVMIDTATNQIVRDSTSGSSGTVTSVGTGYGLSGGTITTTGTIIVDSATLSTKYNRLADTSAMLSPYLRKVDTTAMLSPYLRSNVGAATYLPLAGANYGTTTGTGLALTSSTVTTGNLMSLTNTGTVATSNTKNVLAIVSSGANGTASQTVTGQTISVTNTGTTNTNVGLNVSASGATNNYGLLVPAGNVGIGTTSPVSSLHIVTSLGSVQPRNLCIDNYGDNTYAGSIMLRKARGTVLSPTALLLNDGVGAITFDGWDTGFGTGTQHPATIQVLASENWGSGASGTDMIISLTPNASAVEREVCRFGNDGKISAIGHIKTGVGTMVYPSTNGFSSFSSSGNNGLNITNTLASSYSQILLGQTTSLFGGIFKWNSTYAGNYDGGSLPFASSLQIQSGSGNDNPLVLSASKLIHQVGIAAGNNSFYSDIIGTRIGTNADMNTAITASAKLELKSTTQGLLIPRMTNTQMNAISSPATGLLTFNTDTASLYGYNGTNWQRYLTPNSSGNVGIGTTSPGAKLDVRGGTELWGADNTTALALNVKNLAGTTAFSLRGYGDGLMGSTTYWGSYNSSTYMGLGTQGISSNQPTGNSFVTWIHNNGTYAVRVKSNSDILLQENSGANVGIGTTSPTAKLHVLSTETTGNGILDSTSTLTTGNIDAIKSTSTVVDGGSGLNISMSGANSTASKTVTGQTISVTNTGTTSTNVGLNVTASGATNNTAISATSTISGSANGNLFTTNMTPSTSVNAIGTNFTTTITPAAGASGTGIGQQVTINQGTTTNLLSIIGYSSQSNITGASGTTPSLKGINVGGSIAGTSAVSTAYGYTFQGLFPLATGAVGTQYGYFYDQTYMTPTIGYAFYSAVNPSGGTLASATAISIMPGGSNGVGIGTTSPDSLLTVNTSLHVKTNSKLDGTLAVTGATTLTGIKTGYVAKTANYTATLSDYTINVTANSNNYTLPTAVSATGQEYIIKNTGAGTPVVNTTSSQTIDGSLTYTLGTNKYVHVQSDGANWIIIGNN